ncbi:hypothetical protein [Streptomyces sp. NPDC001480]|uniref:hypothetical protein n=1 Tax=Streptomyces sp. NPDC001480 TaxID=3364577 RepID=UPI0036B9E221
MDEDRERYDMTQTDIAFLLADTADSVAIGTAPVEAVMRGGRRRKARRWAVAAATAVMLAGATVTTLAYAGLTGGHGERGAPAATRPAPQTREVGVPEWADLSGGKYEGKAWQVGVQVWPAPHNESEAAAQWDAMGNFGYQPESVTRYTDLIGKTSVSAILADKEGRGKQVLFNKLPPATGMQAGLTPLAQVRTPFTLVIGEAAKSAKEITCHWKDGNSSVARRGEETYSIDAPNAALRPAAAYPGANWFVCAAPKGTDFESVEVTK